MSDLQIFPPVCGVSLHFLISSFAEKEFLVLIKSNFSMDCAFNVVSKTDFLDPSSQRFLLHFLLKI